MADDDKAFLKAFFRSLKDRELSPDDYAYVPLFSDKRLAPSDPIESMATCIEFSDLESTQLFSGFRGTGKSTELRRLKKILPNDEFKVVLCHMQDYLNLSTPVDISDFLIAVAGAFSDALEDDDLLGQDMAREGYWTRLINFLTRTNIVLTEFGLGAKAGLVDGVEASASFKASLKQDPSFRALLQERMKGHLGALVDDVRKFMEECVKAIKARFGDETQVVLLLDSIEQIRGTSMNADAVYSSVENLFVTHFEKLRFPYIHTVYTAPPWLKIRAGGMAGLYDGYEMVPCVKVFHQHRIRCDEGIEKLIEVVGKRGNWLRLLGDKEHLEDLIVSSGGHIRDLFRLLRGCITQARGKALPVTPETLELVKNQLKNSYLPVSHEDAVWLDNIRETQQPELPKGEDLKHLSRFFDTHLVLSYRNGEEWYRVHPSIEAQVQTQASAYKARLKAEAQDAEQT